MVNPGEVVTVAKKGGDFTSIVDAIAFIVTQSPSGLQPWSINVTSGVYVEVNPIVIPSFISIVGISGSVTRVLPTDPTQELFNIGGHSVEVSGITAMGTTSAALFKYDGGPFFNTNIVLKDMFFVQYEVGIDISNTNGAVSMAVYNISTPVTDTYQRRLVRFTQTTDTATNFIAVLMEALQAQFLILPTVSNPFTLIETIGFTGASPIGLWLRNILIIIPGPSTTVGISVENTVLNVVGFQIDYAGSMLTIPNSTLPTIVKLISITAQLCTKDVIILNNNASGSIQGVMDATKIDESSAPNHTVNFLIQNSNTGGVDLTGEFSVGTRISNRTNLLPAIQGDITIGVYTGGTLSATGGLNISVAAGTGYITSGTPSDPLVYVTWDSPLTTAIPANSDRYVSVIVGGVLQLTAAAPNTYTAILIGRVKTDATTVLFVENISAEALHSSTLFDQTFREAFGTVVAAGLIVGAGTSNYQVNMTSGNYYYSTHKFSPAGGTDLTFTEFFRVATVWTNGSPTSSLSAANARRYDDGSDLVALVATQYAKHVLYVVNDSVDETYLFIYGQETFATQNDAENGALPLPPSFMSEAFVPVGAFIVSDTSTNWIVVQDVRPTLAFRSAGVTATADHGSLAGLLDDDHPQYLLINGSRAMSATLDMDSNNIVNAGTINGVTITSLSARLQPGGSDPLSAATAPSTISTTNLLGTSNDLARADHVHAHGAQTDGSLHATATGSVAGFMSAADKTTFDAATALSTISTLMLRDGSGGTAVDQLTVDSNGVVRLANTANTFHTSIVALPGLTADYTLTLPPNDGDSGQVLQTDGAGATSWTSPNSGGTVYYTSSGPVSPVTGDWRTRDDSGVLKTERYNGSIWVEMWSLTPP